MGLTINPLITGALQLDKGALSYFVDYGKSMWVPVQMWYIKAGDKNILVDTSAPNSVLEKHWGASADIVSFEDALATVGITPEDVDIVLQTHLHFDHCGNNAKCKKAEHIVQADELEFARDAKPPFVGNYGAYLLEGVNWNPIMGDQDIVPGIKVIRAAGHSPGTMSVMVDTDSGKAAITGFCCLSDCFNPPEPWKASWEVLTPGIHTNSVDAYASALKIKNMADFYLTAHDIDYARLKSFPGDGSTTPMARWFEENKG